MTPNDGFPQGYRRIVLCFDGTGDWVENDVTNVARMFACLDRTDQLCYYDAGVGTLGDSRALGDGSQMALKLIDLGTATSLGDKVAQAYAYLVRNHRPGMEIHMLGFSRGAFTARILAGMILNFGLLRPELEHLAPYLYQSVATIPDTKAAIKNFKINAARLRHDFCRSDEVLIQFMGMFDTVTSVGIVDRFRVFPNTDRNPAVLRACHAVAIEEARNAFPETLMHPNQKNMTEVWFPGVHRDCGGGIEPEKARIANEALLWMEREADRAGMGLTQMHLPDRTQPLSPNYPTLDPYVFLGFYPQKTFIKRVSGFRVLWPNFRHVRTIPERALIHETVAQAYAEGCLPPNMPEGWTWFRTGDETLSEGPYLVRQVGMNGQDAMGTILGTAMLAQAWNWAVGCPFGPSLPGSSWPLRFFPTPHGWIEALLVVGFLFAQAVGKGLFSDDVRTRVRPLLDRFLPVAGALVGLATAGPVAWSILRGQGVPEGTLPVILGLAVGGVAWAVAQVGGMPVVRADRALPFLLRNGFYAFAALWTFHRVVGWWLPGWMGPTPMFAGVALLAILFALLELFRDRPIMAANDTKEVSRRRPSKATPDCAPPTPPS